MANSYFTLTAGEEYLKNFGPLDSEIGDEQSMTADDLLAAEKTAYDEIRSRLAGMYDMTGWDSTPPPLIAEAAKILGSSYAWAMKFAQSGMIPDAGRPEGLRRLAMSILDGVVSGGNKLLDASGNILSKTIAATLVDIET